MYYNLTEEALSSLLSGMLTDYIRGRVMNQRPLLTLIGEYKHRFLYRERRVW